MFVPAFALPIAVLFVLVVTIVVSGGVVILVAFPHSAAADAVIFVVVVAAVLATAAIAALALTFEPLFVLPNDDRPVVNVVVNEPQPVE